MNLRNAFLSGPTLSRHPAEIKPHDIKETYWQIDISNLFNSLFKKAPFLIWLAFYSI